MREIAIRVPASAVEEVLDALLPIVPGGVREREDGDEVELVMHGPDLPAPSELAHAAGRFGGAVRERTVSDDWRERRKADYRPLVIGERLVVRPPWAPAAAGMIDIVLEESAAFGAGTHPTTRACLELMLAMAPGGSFADLGCGSGVLAILACRLGWTPVSAVDAQPASIEATRRNATANGVAVRAALADLSHGPSPAATGFVANVPPAVHAAIAAGWRDAPGPRIGLVSGFGPGFADAVIDAYAAIGLCERCRHQVHGWVVAELFA